MTIEKLPSGSYRITQMYHGKRYRKTLPYKPTQKEAVRIMADLFDGLPEQGDGYSVGYYLEKYLDDCRNRSKELSPTTIKNYGSIVRNISDQFKAKRFFDVTEQDVRQELIDYGKTRSNKSVKNLKGYLTCVFASYRPQFTFTHNLPTEEPKAEYEPTTDDIKRILDYAKGSKYEIALRLSVLGLRRGEILALEPSDLSDMDILTIDKSMAVNEANLYVIKETKTQASTRRIKIPHDLAELIRQQGKIYDGHPQMINKYLHSVQDALGIPHFRSHVLRHFAAAFLHKNGFTTEQILSYGGWSTDNVMKRAYRYNLDPEESQEQIVKSFESLVGKSVGKSL